MEKYKFNCIGAKRKALVGAIGELLNQSIKYLGVPTFGYEVGGYHIDREGTVEGEESLSLLVGLAECGFEVEHSKTYHLITPRGTLLIRDHFTTAQEATAAGYGIYFHHEGRDVYIKPTGETEHGKHFAVVGAPFAPKSPDGEVDLISIEMPLEDFTPEALDNLTKMVLAKEPLLKKSLGVEELPIELEEDSICFPWFTATDNDNIAAYTQFIAALCDTAKRKKRVTVKAQDMYENEKFAMRVWLIGLGLVGKEYSAARKLLVNNRLSGNSAYRYGKPLNGDCDFHE